MTAEQRPIRVEVTGLRDLLPLPPVKLMFWSCRSCANDAGLPEAAGWADTVGEAVDAGLEHLADCPPYVAALDRLLADVLAVPKIRTLRLPLHPEGTAVDVVFCGDCGVALDDWGSHVEQHLTASGVSRG